MDLVSETKMLNMEHCNIVTRKGKYGRPPISVPQANGSQSNEQILRKKKNVSM